MAKALLEIASKHEEFKSQTMLFWEVKNFSCWSKDIHGESIVSPEFQLAGTSINTVRVKLFPKGLPEEEPHFRVQIELLGRLLPPIPVTCEAYFFDKRNGVPLASMNARDQELLVTKPLLLPPGPTYEDVLHNKSYIFFPECSLTLHCHIYRLDEVHEEVKCVYSAFSNIEFRETRYIWPVEYFRNMETDTEIILPLELNIFPQSFTVFRWVLRIPGSSDPNSMVSFKVAHLDETEVFLVKIQMALLNARNQPVKFLDVRSVIRLPLPSNEATNMPNFLTRQELLESNNYALSVTFITSLPSVSECIQKIFVGPGLMIPYVKK